MIDMDINMARTTYLSTGCCIILSERSMLWPMRQIESTLGIFVTAMATIRPLAW